MPFEPRPVREARYDAIAARYRERPPTPLDRLAELEQAYRRLVSDLHDADGDLDADSRTDWPPSCEAVTPELSVGEQLSVLHTLAEALVQLHGLDAARPLAARVRSLLEVAPGFTAPARSLRPPRAVASAIERLRAVTPPDAALATLRPEDTGEIACDRRLVAWYAAVVDEP